MTSTKRPYRLLLTRCVCTSIIFLSAQSLYSYSKSVAANHHVLDLPAFSIPAAQTDLHYHTVRVLTLCTDPPVALKDATPAGMRPASLFVLLPSLALLSTAYTIRHASTGQGISPQLFDELDELARVVDISYCVGFTGIQSPFSCAGHCDDFPSFELIQVLDPTFPSFSTH